MAVPAVILLAVSLMISVCADGIVFGYILHPQNAYEEIWNMVWTEQHTKSKTVLTTATDDAVVDYDFGVEFVGIHIPQSNVTLAWETENQALLWLFPLGDGEYVRFVYTYRTKTLTGNRSDTYLADRFLTPYYEWCDAVGVPSAYAPTEGRGQ